MVRCPCLFLHTWSLLTDDKTGFFTLAIGSLVGVESFSVPKLGSVLMRCVIISSAMICNGLTQVSLPQLPWRLSRCPG